MLVEVYQCLLSIENGIKGKRKSLETYFLKLFFNEQHLLFKIIYIQLGPIYAHCGITILVALYYLLYIIHYYGEL